MSNSLNKIFSTCAVVLHLSINMFMSAAKAFYLEFDSFLESGRHLCRWGNFLLDKIRSFLQLFEGCYITDVTVLFLGGYLFIWLLPFIFVCWLRNEKKSCFKVLLYYWNIFALIKYNVYPLNLQFMTYSFGSFFFLYTFSSQLNPHIYSLHLCIYLFTFMFVDASWNLTSCLYL